MPVYEYLSDEDTDEEDGEDNTSCLNPDLNQCVIQLRCKCSIISSFDKHIVFKSKYYLIVNFDSYFN